MLREDLGYTKQERTQLVEGRRRAAHAAMQKWLGSSAESATGISGDFVMLPESAQETELAESTNCRPESN